MKQPFKKFFFIRDRISKREGERGVIFIMALVISATLIAIALALSTIIMGELRISGDAGYYIPAFYAADAGVEKGLYCKRNGVSCAQNAGASYCQTNATFCSPQITLGNNTVYFYEVDNNGVNGCAAPNLCIFSKGTYLGLGRRIQVSY